MLGVHPITHSVSRRPLQNYSAFREEQKKYRREGVLQRETENTDTAFLSKDVTKSYSKGISIPPSSNPKHVKILEISGL